MKNKKTKILIALILAAVLLGAAVCVLVYSRSSVPEKVEKKTEAPEKEEQKAPPKESQAIPMSNHNNDGKFLLEEGVLYYTDYEAEGGSSLVSRKLGTEEKTVLQQDCTAMCLALYKGALYGVIWKADTQPGIYKIPLDGGAAELLVEGAGDLQILDDKLYYNKVAETDGDYLNKGFYCCEADGSGESLLLDKATYDTYVVDGKIYFQDDEDGCTLHMVDMATEEDKRLTKTACYSFVLDGDTGYYVEVADPDQETSGNLTKMEMDTGVTSVLAGDAYREAIVVTTDRILYCDGQDNFRISLIDKGRPGKKELVEINHPDNICAGEGKLMFVDSDSSWMYVEGIYICNEDGTGLERLDQ